MPNINVKVLNCEKLNFTKEGKVEVAYKLCVVTEDGKIAFVYSKTAHQGNVELYVAVYSEKLILKVKE